MVLGIVKTFVCRVRKLSATCLGVWPCRSDLSLPIIFRQRFLRTENCRGQMVRILQQLFLVHCSTAKDAFQYRDNLDDTIPGYMPFAGHVERFQRAWSCSMSKLLTPMNLTRPSVTSFSIARMVSVMGILPGQCSKYISSQSVFSRFKLCLQALIVPSYVPWEGKTLLTKNTLSRCPAMASATNSSVWPSPYISAVSM